MTTSKALRTRPRHMQKALWETVEPYVFLAPALIIFGLFLYYPFIRTIYLSLFLTDKYGMAKVFWGVGNYTSIFSDPSFWRSLTVTFKFVVMVAVGGPVGDPVRDVPHNHAGPVQHGEKERELLMLALNRKQKKPLSPWDIGC